MSALLASCIAVLETLAEVPGHRMAESTLYLALGSDLKDSNTVRDLLRKQGWVEVTRSSEILLTEAGMAMASEIASAKLAKAGR